MDDEANYRENASSISTEIAPCTTVGETLEQVTYEIVLGFYFLAVVDLVWVVEKRKLRLGSQLLELIKRFQPLCECVISSRQIGNDEVGAESPGIAPQTISEDLSRCFSISRPLATSFVAKGYTAKVKKAINDRVRELGIAEADKPVEVAFDEGCMPMVTRWAQTVLDLLKDVCQASEIAPALSFEIKDFSKAQTKLYQSLLLECDFLVSRICGQGSRSQLPPPIKRIALESLDGGKSSAMVLIGRPEMEEVQNRASWLVFKIDFRERIEEEVQSYNRHIKFRVSRHRRVELLGHDLGSRLGSICYTFIGVDPKQPTTMRTKFNLLRGKPDKTFRDQTKKLFATPDLHAINDVPFDDISEYFQIRLRKRKPFDFQAKWKEFRSQLEIMFSQHSIDNSNIPSDPTSTPEFGTTQPAVWTHGDLHLGNIVVGDADELMLIDFRDTGRAPRVLDFVVLATSIRMEACNFMDASDILAASKEGNEALLLKTGLGTPEFVNKLQARISKLSEVGLLLFDLHQTMVSTFRPDEAGNEDTENGDLSRFLKKIKGEYVACSFAWACLIFQKLSDEAGRKSREKSGLRKELDPRGQSTNKRELVNEKIDKVENEAELIEKQRLAIGLYLCFLGNQMS